jgi:hypothetical protein
VLKGDHWPTPTPMKLQAVTTLLPRGHGSQGAGQQSKGTALSLVPGALPEVGTPRRAKRAWCPAALLLIAVVFFCGIWRTSCRLRDQQAREYAEQASRWLAHAAAARAAWKAQQEVLEAADLARVRAFPRCPGKCVISFGLYGADPKYTQGMIRNAELASKYFPGWVVRAYTDGSSPQAVYDRIRALGGEIVVIEGVGGGIAGMFWRFLVADDATVDRYIVRDSDSRLNLRERFAVQEWIDSGKAIHSIRDHPNHERPLNGGMWGGVKGAIPDMAGKVKGYGNRHTYGGDLDFLGDLIWPLVKHDQISHDAYSCAKFPNSRSFPTQRPANMQHVGQVYFADETTRDTDITCCMLNVKAPMACRRKPEWTNG